MRILSIVAALLCAGCSTALPPSQEAVLEHGDSYQLMLVHSARFDSSPRPFHECLVDKTLTVSDPKARHKLIATLKSDLGGGFSSLCLFDPHYAVHITQGSHTLDMEICFHCYQCEVFDETGKRSSYTISSDGKAAFESLIPD